MKKNRLRTRRTSVHGWFLCAAAGAVVLSAAPAAHADEPSLTPRFEKSQHFTVDPVVDGVLISTSYGFSLLLGLVLGTGEIRPSLPGSTDKLLAIDRVAVTQSIDPHAGTYSNIGIWVAYGYVLLDLAHSGLRDGRNALLVDAIMYAESLSLTSMLTSMTKIAVRRPRPIDYVNCGSSETAPGGGLYDRHESTAVVLLGARIRRRGDERDGHVSGVRSQRRTFGTPLDHARGGNGPHGVHQLRARPVG